MKRNLPNGFKLGVASAAFQMDGVWGGSEASKKNQIDRTYRFYRQDVTMVKWLGVDFYKFSIMWSRILPTGFPDKISKEGSSYYRKYIDALLARGIEPVVIMHHWDIPQKLQDLGGWANPLIVDWFEDYARLLFTLYGDKVKTWITINEPKQTGLIGNGTGRATPGVKAHGVGEYLAAKHMLLAHARAWRLYDKEFREKQKGSCGISIGTDYLQGMTDSPADVQAGLDAMDFEVGLYAHPIFSSKGGFPDSVVRLVGERSREQGYPRSRLPEFTEEEKKLVKGTSDFYGFNYYSTRFYSRSSYFKGMYLVPSCDDDLGAAHLGSGDLGAALPKDAKKPVIPQNAEMPAGIRNALKWVKDSFNNPPIMITENGFGTLGGLQDDDRISYLKKHVASVLDAVEKDQCGVFAYTVCSLMDDDFEVDSGNSMKFGIFETEYDGDEELRRARASAFWYRQLAVSRSFDPEYKPTLKKQTF